MSHTNLAFPADAIVGSLGDLARLLAAGTEVPEEFYFAASLTVLGSICGTDLGLNIGFEVEPRLYTVLLGESYDVKKSSAMKKTLEFFDKLKVSKSHVSYGVGSAEGLARELSEHPQLILAYDELRAFVDKTKVQSSVLLPMVAALFEVNRWDNSLKNAKHSTPVRNAHLSLLGCCTTATYSDMWTTEAISIGFPNRLFVVGADAKPRVAWPAAPDTQSLDQIRVRIQQQIGKLPLKFDITPEANDAWKGWYDGLHRSEHSKRLDTIGFRLIPLIALITDKTVIDVETIQTVTSILDYELKMRYTTDPIDADNTISKLETKIRRVLEARGPQSKRDLRRHTHADRAGIWAFEKSAIKNLIQAGDIEWNGQGYALRAAEAA